MKILFFVGRYWLVISKWSLRNVHIINITLFYCNVSLYNDIY
jgi:hypothetical protein